MIDVNTGEPFRAPSDRLTDQRDGAGDTPVRKIQKPLARMTGTEKKRCVLEPGIGARYFNMPISR